MKTTIFGTLTQGLVHLFYPSLCEGCGKALLNTETVLCIGCKMQIPQTNYHHHLINDTVLRFAGRIPIIHASTFAYFINDGLLQHLLHGLKYGNKQDIGRFLGAEFAYSLLQLTDWITTIDLIIPVPLHPKKEQARGYNQSMLLAEGMSKVLNIPATDKLLLRVKHTDSQTKKSRADRLTNMQGAFSISNTATLKNKHILLIDDVLTTGATLEACALVLLQIEGIKISIATIGIAV